tara:strand:- start:465 stop:773 length:309 start_codon:yes stop_codon:yes gene_type:complete
MSNEEFCSAIENYCGCGKLSKKEVDFLEDEHYETMKVIGAIVSPAIAPGYVAESLDLTPEEGDYWISCNAAILDQVRPIEDGPSRFSEISKALKDYGLVRVA